jgi:FlaA1/EpsC-like NDP-sugar epimerase
METKKLSDYHFKRKNITAKLTKIKFFILLYYYTILVVIVEKYYVLKRRFLGQSLSDLSKLHDLTGCVCLINGAANGNIGRHVIEKIAKSNCYLIITVFGDDKFIEKTKNDLVKNELKNINSSQYRFEYADMLNFDSIIRLAKKLNDSSQKINFFISNACKFLI